MPTTGVVTGVSQRPSIAKGLGPDGAKVAEMVRPWMAVYTQVPVPLHGAPQPEKRKPTAGVAVSVSWVWAGYLAEQPVAAGVPPAITQSIAGVSPGWLVTLPLPAPWVPLAIWMV